MLEEVEVMLRAFLVEEAEHPRTLDGRGVHFIVETLQGLIE